MEENNIQSPSKIQLIRECNGITQLFFETTLLDYFTGLQQSLLSVTWGWNKRTVSDLLQGKDT